MSVRAVLPPLRKFMSNCFGGCRGLRKRRDASDVHSRNEEVDVMGAFVSNNRFKVHHVAHDRVLVHDSHCTEHLACFASDGDSHIDVVTFCHRDLGRGSTAFVAELSEAEG